MVKINNLISNPNVSIYGKLEGQNIGGSMKDRVALRMIEEGEKNGELKQNKTIIEASSGNTGIGLAMIGKLKGYNIEIIMSEGVSKERQKIIKAFGANIILTDKKEKTDGAIRKVKEKLITNPKKYWNPDQYSNKNNPLSHYYGTAEEIIKQVPDLTYFIASIGTSGTLMGISKKLKEYNPEITIISANPQKKHKIQGLKNMEESIIPKIYDRSNIDEKIIIKNEDAFSTSRKLAIREGLFLGMSSGAAMYAALEVAKRIKKGKIVVLFPDRGERYISTELF
jgi:S-sulfo-L-cysteine synthase (O-acetyl-L-serine-dependent)